MGTGLHCLWREQPLGDGSCAVWPPGIPSAGRRLQSVSGHGIDRQLEIDHVCNENLYKLSLEEIAARGIKTLPQSLKEACDALEADPLFAEVLGDEIVSEFIRLKRMEWVEYSRHVSDWEVKRYIEFF